MTEPQLYRYTGPEDVTIVLAPSGDIAGTAAELPGDALGDEIASAEDRIDAELAGRYGAHIPFDPVPPVVRRIARDIAAYNADLTYRGAARLGFGDYDPILMRYQQAANLLARLASGAAELAVRTLDVTSTSGGRAGSPRNPHSGMFSEVEHFAGGRRAPVDQPWLDW